MKATYWIGIVCAFSCLACDEPDPVGGDAVPPTNTDIGQPADPTTMDDRPTAQDRMVDGKPDDDKAHKAKEAKADIEAATGRKIDGEARFSEHGKGVKIVVNVKDAPSGEKGIHIHEKGDCSDIAGKSMGSHFAPEGDKHGLPDQAQDEIHLGDLGNIEIKDDGTGKKEITIEKANLTEGDPMSLLGKALVIHEGKDEGAAKQPSGGSGKPIACGVIKKA